MLRPLGASLLALFVLVAPVTPAVAQSGTDARLRALEQQLELLQREIKTLRAERETEIKAQQAEAKKQEEAAKAQAETERKTNVLTDVVEQIRESLTIPEEIKLEGQYGLGPAASKVYGARGLSIGGYGEVVFRKPVSDKDNVESIADLQRFVLYTGYKFNDWVVLNAEVEVEHAKSSSGEVEMEFAYLDFFLRDYANARGGLVLVPMGIINEVHEPVFFYGVDRPEVDLRIIPTTWREIGAGMFGRITEDLQYRMFGITSFDATGFNASGLRNGRQSGSFALANDWAFVGRVDYQPMLSLIMGTSAFWGDSGQSQVIEGVRIPSTPTTIWEIHGQWRYRGFEARTEYAMAWVGDARTLTLALQEIGNIPTNEAIANQMLGMYVEGAYDVMPWIIDETEQALLPFARFEYVNTQWDMPSGFTADNFYQDRIYTAGLNYKPIPQVVLKVDYRIFKPVSGEKPDFVNFGLGFVF